MQLTVYADVLFLTNFIINLFLLYVTGSLSKTNTSFWRLALSSSIGGIYAICMFLPETDFLSSVLSKFILSQLMLICAFPIKSFLGFIKNMSLFYLVSIVCGGCVFAISVGGKGGFTLNNGILYYNTNLRVVLISGILGFILIKASMGIYKKYALRDYKKMILCKNGRAVKLNVLIDTGNMLKDPLSGNPVIIVSKEALSGIIPIDANADDMEEMCRYIKDIRLIPFKAVGTENGIMTGFIPDEIIANCNICPNITIAISNESLCHNKEYNALAGPESFIK